MGAAEAVTELSKTVIAGGYCIGCGGCSSLHSSPYEIGMDSVGRLQARLLPGHADHPMADEICPFGARAISEDVIATELYPEAPLNPQIGRHIGIWSGYVAESDFRERGSSGGMGNWLATELLERGEVDAVIHVRPNEDGRLFGFAISHTAEEVRNGNKSRYYPVQMGSVLSYIRDTPERFALVGVPCMIKAARLQARFDPVIRERLKFTIALVCGHLKSEHFAGMFAWQLGIHPTRISAIDFRVKNETGRADHYSIQVEGTDPHGTPISSRAQNKSFFGHLWGHGFFKYRACDYCDDVFGETADITVGDAWLPGLSDDPRGTNVVVSRDPAIDQLVRDAVAKGRLHLAPLSAEDAARSQDAGLRHRRRGLAVRLGDAIRSGRWVPPKRIAPYSDGLDQRQRRVYRIRERMSERSHSAFQKALRRNDFEVFRRAMQPWIYWHDYMNRRIGLRGMIRQMLRLAVSR